MLKYAIKTYGCKLNRAESGNLEKVLDFNFQKGNLQEADIVVINSCGVITKTELKILKEIKRLKKEGKTVILTGCLPSITDNLEKKVDLILKGNGPKEFEKLINSHFNLNQENNYKKISTKQETDSCSVIIPISSGCMGNCTYCATKFARGALISYSEDKILEEIKKELRKGAKEIQLTSQDLAVYGRERGEFLLIDLLKKIIAIDQNFRIKLGMMNISFLKEFFTYFLPLFEDPKIYNFLHLPLQTGSNKVLKDMNRGYQREDFIEIIKSIRSCYQDFIIATDIIVGFPTEGDEDFNKSYNLIRNLNLDIVNITRYSERKNTSAERMEDMPSKIKKRRSRKLSKLTKKQRIKKNKKTIGKIYEGLIVRKGKKNTKLARLDNGKAVVLQKGEIGTFNKIKITDYKHNYLIGRIYD